MKYRNIFVLITTIALTSCSLSTRGKVNKLISEASDRYMPEQQYCYSLYLLQEARKEALNGFGSGSTTIVLQNYVNNYNRMMDSLKNVNSQSRHSDIETKAQSYICWLPEMRHIMELMPPEMQTQIKPEYNPFSVSIYYAASDASDAWYRSAQKESNKTKKLYKLLSCYYYTPDNQNIISALQNTYTNAIYHLIIKNTSNKEINGINVITDKVIPMIERPYQKPSLNKMMDSAGPYIEHPLSIQDYRIDIKQEPQKTGNNIVITLHLNKAERFSENYSQTVPEERQGAAQSCYDHPVLERDRDNVIRKTGLNETHCINTTYTYAVDTTQSGVNYTTVLDGVMTLTLNGRVVIKNQKIGASYSSADSTNDITQSWRDIVDQIEDAIRDVILSDNQ